MQCQYDRGLYPGEDAKAQNAAALWGSQFLAQCSALGKGYMQLYPEVGW